jgi:hypothetical protein
MIEFGTLTEITLPMIAARVADNTLEQGALAVFVDERRSVRALAHHAPDFDAIVQRRATDLIGVYVARPDYARGKKQGWPITDDLRVRLDELYAEAQKAA